jgi:hypothetical protein
MWNPFSTFLGRFLRETTWAIADFNTFKSIPLKFNSSIQWLSREKFQGHPNICWVKTHSDLFMMGTHIGNERKMRGDLATVKWSLTVGHHYYWYLREPETSFSGRWWKWGIPKQWLLKRENYDKLWGFWGTLFSDNPNLRELWVVSEQTANLWVTVFLLYLPGTQMTCLAEPLVGREGYHQIIWIIIFRYLSNLNMIIRLLGW